MMEEMEMEEIEREIKYLDLEIQNFSDLEIFTFSDICILRFKMFYVFRFFTFLDFWIQRFRFRVRDLDIQIQAFRFRDVDIQIQVFRFRDLDLEIQVFRFRDLDLKITWTLWLKKRNGFVLRNQDTLVYLTLLDNFVPPCLKLICVQLPLHWINFTRSLCLMGDLLLSSLCPPPIVFVGEDEEYLVENLSYYSLDRVSDEIRNCSSERSRKGIN